MEHVLVRGRGQALLLRLGEGGVRQERVLGPVLCDGEVGSVARERTRGEVRHVGRVAKPHVPRLVHDAHGAARVGRGRDPGDGGHVAEPQRREVRERQPTHLRGEVAQGVRACVAVGGGVARPAAADPVGDQDDHPIASPHGASITAPSPANQKGGAAV